MTTQTTYRCTNCGEPTTHWYAQDGAGNRTQRFGICGPDEGCSVVYAAEQARRAANLRAYVEA